MQIHSHYYVFFFFNTRKAYLSFCIGFTSNYDTDTDTDTIQIIIIMDDLNKSLYLYLYDRLWARA